jgi:hypothetical protein
MGPTDLNRYLFLVFAGLWAVRRWLLANSVAVFRYACSEVSLTLSIPSLDRSARRGGLASIACGVALQCR